MIVRSGAVAAAAVASSLVVGPAHAAPGFAVPLRGFDRTTLTTSYTNFGAVYQWVNNTYNSQMTDGRLSSTISTYKAGVAKKSTYDEYVVYVDIANKVDKKFANSTTTVQITETAPKNVLRSSNSNSMSSTKSGCTTVNLTLSAGINLGIASLSASGNRTTSVLCSKSARIQTTPQGTGATFTLNDFGHISSASVVHIVDVKKGTVPVFKVATTWDSDLCKTKKTNAGCLNGHKPPYVDSSSYRAVNVK